jgi:glycosyltransferase involved in cell wall biosynthesis/SAM-dependent methyltransferase
VTTSNRLAQLFHSHAEYLSDKWEQYLGIYHLELSRLIREGKPLRLLEIGVQNGGSLQIWSEYLPAGSDIVGIDIDEACAALAVSPNIQILIGDASDPAQLTRLLGGQTFDVVIDDGSHRSPDVIATFESCFSRLNPGGLYFVEDLHCSYQKSFGGGYRDPAASIEWFKGLIDAINCDHIEDPSVIPPLELHRLARLNRSVARIAFYDSVAVIEKFRQPKTQPFGRLLTGGKAPVMNPAHTIWSMPRQEIEAFRFSPAASAAFSATWSEILVAAKDELIAVHGANDAARKAIAAETASSIDELTRQLIDCDRQVVRLENDLSQARDELLQTQSELLQTQSELLQTQSDLSQTQNELSHLQAESAAVWEEVLSNKAEISLDQAAAADQAVKYAALSQELAASQARLEVIQASTAWQVVRRMTTVGAWVPPKGRRVGRRILRAAWWTVTGRLAQKSREFRQAQARLVANPGLPPPSATQGNGSIFVLPSDDPYQLWWLANAPREEAYRLQRRIGDCFELRPVFSVIVPVFRPPLDVFVAMIDSVRAQSYERWQLVLVIVDTGGDSAELLRHASDARRLDPRIHVEIAPDNLGIAGNSNLALAHATGEWIVLLDHDDTIRSDALFRFAESLNIDPEADFLYSDKDMISRDGTRHFSPLFKPAWSPDIMLNANYLTHLSGLRTEMVRRTGGWDSATDGAQDWDLFLKAMQAQARIRHVPHVLYHWRQVPTSVSVGGFAAKPYAAEAQLIALRKYLWAAGWEGAVPEFEGDYIRIRWKSIVERISVILVGEDNERSRAGISHDSGVELLTAKSKHAVASVDAAIGRASGDIIIVLDAAFVPRSPEWIAELAFPLVNPAIAMVAGKVVDGDDSIIDFGIFFQDGAAYPAFRNMPERHYGSFGGAGWYRNVSAAAGGAVAFRRTLWSELGGFGKFRETGRPDLGFALAATRHGRILANPFAVFTSSGGVSLFERTMPELRREFVLAALPNGDPYLSPYMEVEGNPGVPRIVPPKPSPARAPAQDYAAEASYFAHTFDVQQGDIEASIQACEAMPRGPLRHVLWLIPNFQVPFFGGIHTILRAADHLRVHHDVRQSFAVSGASDPDIIRTRIAQAFPELAASADIKLLPADGSLPSFGTVDVAFATLWITAFPLLRMRDVRQKCYFLQDWEPLFYPAGTLSGLVEATYRFGFHAVCNTSSLALSYRAMGGTADYFLPAVDTKLFNATGRVARRQQEPFVLFCYGRPTVPRNCFEALAEGLAELKRRYGRRLDIVFAGGEWDPADYGLAGLARNLGLLSYAGTGQLYRAVDAGIVAMATRHPSYLPFELMASGAAVVTTRNIYTSWLLKDQENCLLCETSRSDIVRAVSTLIDKPDVRDRIVNAGQQVVAANHSDWNLVCRQISASIQALAE